MRSDVTTDAESLCLRLIQAACAPHRGRQLALFHDEGIWSFPLADPGEPQRLVGKAEIAEVMGPRWNAADACGVAIMSREVVVRPFADLSMACSQFELVVERDGVERVRRFVHIVRAQNGLIREVTVYG